MVCVYPNEAVLEDIYPRNLIDSKLLISVVRGNKSIVIYYSINANRDIIIYPSLTCRTSV